MKTQILRLETHDDIASIRDKIAWAKAGRILLAFPKRRPPALTKLDFILIQRTVAQTGAQLGITTRDPDTIRQANILDIPVFASIQAAQRSPWLVVNRKRKVMSLHRSGAPDKAEIREILLPKPHEQPPKALQYILFTLGLTAFLVLILLFVPSAVIEVTPARESQSAALTVFPQLGIPGVLPGGQIPAAEVRTRVSGQMEAVTTASTVVPNTPARVTLLITNQTDKPVSIPAGTVFMALEPNPVRFLATARAELAAGIGKTVELQAEAELPGTEGNVPAGSIDTLAGPLGLQIYVTNPAAAAGGTDRTGRFASEMDYSQLYDALITSLTETAAINMEAQYGGALVIISESIKVERVVEERRQPAIDAPSDRVSLSITADFSGLAVSRNDLAAAAALRMDPGLPAGETVEPGSYTFKNISAPVVLSDGRMSWEIQATRQQVQNVQFMGLPLSVKGLRVDEAQRVVQNNLALDQPPKISVFPSWLPRLPLVPFRIEVISK